MVATAETNYKKVVIGGDYGSTGGGEGYNSIADREAWWCQFGGRGRAEVAVVLGWKSSKM